VSSAKIYVSGLRASTHDRLHLIPYPLDNRPVRRTWAKTLWRPAGCRPATLFGLPVFNLFTKEDSVDMATVGGGVGGACLGKVFCYPFILFEGVCDVTTIV
jgi:hypothetical protein